MLTIALQERAIPSFKRGLRPRFAFCARGRINSPLAPGGRQPHASPSLWERAKSMPPLQFQDGDKTIPPPSAL